MSRFCSLHPDFLSRYLELFPIIIFTSVVFLVIPNGSQAENGDKFYIPYKLLAQDRREEAREIVESHTVFRTFKDLEFKVNEPVLEFMIGHPLFLAATLKAEKIRDYRVRHGTGGMYIFDDRKGISVKFELIYSVPGRRYYYGFGGFNSLFLKLLGRGIVLFQYRGVKGHPPRTYVNAYVYTKIDNIVIDVLLKILKPILMPLMDKKIYNFIEKNQILANRIAEDPKKVYENVKDSGLADVDDLEEFRKLIF